MSAGDAAGERGGFRQERAERKHEQILAAAARLMARQGFQGTSIRDVARETGSSLAGMYHYFASKEDLLFQIQHRVFSDLLAKQERAVGAGTSDEKLRALLRTHLAYFTRHQEELKVCTYELDSLTGTPYEEVKAVRRRYYDLVADVVGDLLGRADRNGPGESGPVSVRHAALFVFGMLNWIFMWFDPERDGPAERLGDEMYRLVMQGLAGARAGR